MNTRRANVNETLRQWWTTSALPSEETLRIWVAVTGLVTWAWLMRSARALAWVPPLALGAIVVGRALQRAWIADDAFISFRFAANWAHGLGPVWNQGERVEGYTNPLWMALAALGEKLGAPAPYFSSALNLLVAFTLVAGLWWGVRRAFPGAAPILPVVLSLSPAIREFGTSGLETLPASTAITFAAIAVLLGWRWRTAAALVCLAALLRPDHALFFAPLGFASVATGSLKARVRNALELALPALVFAMFWVVRWRWYGDFYPNTYYAKSGDLPYWSQGAIYVQEFAASSRLWWPLAVVPLILAVLAKSRAQVSASPPAPSRSLAPFFIFAGGGAALMLLYVARVGGDFMEFRFALTTLPLLGLVSEVLLLRRQGPPLLVRFAASFIALLPLAQADGLISPMQKPLHIARESSFYAVNKWFPLEIDGAMFQSAIGLHESHPPPELVAAGCVGMLGYYNLDVPIFDTFGKTSREIAHRPVTVRGRPGHEKLATQEEVLRSGAVWSVDPVWTEFDSETRFTFPRGRGWLIRATPGVVRWLRANGAATSMEAILNRATDATTAAEHFDELQEIFSRQPTLLTRHFEKSGLVSPAEFNCDAERQHCNGTLSCHHERLELEGDESCAFPGGARVTTCDAAFTVTVTCHSPHRAKWMISRQPGDFEERLKQARADGALAIARALKTAPADSDYLVATLNFDSGTLPAEISVTGDAMTYSPGTAAGQQAVRGFTGAGLLNTYVRGDLARGELTAHFALPSEQALLELSFGGGSNCQKIHVDVSVDGRAVARVCGHQDEVLRRSAWLLPSGGKQLTLHVVDASSEGWGHLLLDDVRLWRVGSAQDQHVIQQNVTPSRP